MYTCSNCAIHSCTDETRANMPRNCPMLNEECMDGAFQKYNEQREFYIASSEIEAVGYGEWPRLREIIEFCKRMEYTKVGMAFCIGLKNEAKIIDRILREHGFEVVSVICKTGGISKEQAGIKEEYKLSPGKYEPMCNPIAQAELINEQQTQFNIIVGLCVGHDSLFMKYSDAMATTLIAKDRVLAHNPAGAVYCSEGYFKSRLAPRD